jgi:hypothetical protein
MGRRKLPTDLITWHDLTTDEYRDGQVWSEAPVSGWWVRPLSPRDPGEFAHVTRDGSGYISTSCPLSRSA